MKKISISLLIICILSTIAYSYIGSMVTLEVEDIQEVTLIKDSNKTTIKDDDYHYFVALIKAEKEATKVQHHTELYPFFDLDIKKKNGQHVTRILFTNSERSYLYVKYKDDTFAYPLTDKAIESLLSSDVLDSLYLNEGYPSVHLISEDLNSVQSPGQIMWQYSRLDKSSFIFREKAEIILADEQTAFEIKNYNQKIKLQLKDNYKIKRAVLYARIDDKKVGLELDENHCFKPLRRNGKTQYYLDITTDTQDNLSSNGYGLLQYEFNLKLSFPPEVTLNKSKEVAGGYFLIKGSFIDKDAKVIIEQTILKEAPMQYRVGDDIFSVIPLDYWAKAGKYPIKVYMQSAENKVLIYENILEVLSREYKVQNLKISKSIDKSTRTDAAYKEYREEFMPVRHVSEPKQLWEGAFIMPVEGRLTTDYGTKRRVNGSMTHYRHNGIDLAAPQGTPIKASNSGKVVFSRHLILTGNTVVIDHGLGFFSYYLHMHELDVKKGDSVKKGEIIGTVGSTGFSTGPHLHFTTSYHTKNINPYILMKWDGSWPNK